MGAPSANALQRRSRALFGGVVRIHLLRLPPAFFVARTVVLHETPLDDPVLRRVETPACAQSSRLRPLPDADMPARMGILRSAIACAAPLSAPLGVCDWHGRAGCRPKLTPAASTSYPSCTPLAGRTTRSASR